MEAKTVTETVQHHQRQKDKESCNAENTEDTSDTKTQRENTNIQPTNDDILAEFRTLGLPRKESPGVEKSDNFGDSQEDDIIITGVPKGGFPQDEEFIESEEKQMINETSGGDDFPSEDSGRPDMAEELKT